MIFMDILYVYQQDSRKSSISVIVNVVSLVAVTLPLTFL